MKKVLAAVILIYLLIQFPNIFSKFTNDDEQLYAWLSFKYYQNPANIFLKESTDFWRPLIPLMTAPLILFFDPVTAIRLMVLLISCIGIYGIYFLGKEINGELTGIVSSIFLAFFSPYLYFGAKGVLDVPLAVETILFTYFLLKYIEGKSITPMILIAFIGFFTKQIGFAFFPLAFLVAIYKNRNKIKFTITTIIGVAIVLLAGLFLVQLYRPLSFNQFQNVFFIFPIIEKEIFNHVLLPFYLIGLISFVAEKNQKTRLIVAITTYFLLPFLGFAFPDARLMSQTIPLLMLTAGHGFSKIKLPKLKFELYFLLTIAITISLIQIPFSSLILFDIYNVEPISNQLQEWIINEIKPNDLLLISAPSELFLREPRLAAELGLSKKNNTLGQMPNSKENFESLVKNSEKRIVLLAFKKKDVARIAIIEPNFTPNWIYKLDQDTEEYLSKLGFKKINSFEKTKPFSDEKYEYLEVFELNK